MAKKKATRKKAARKKVAKKKVAKKKKKSYEEEEGNQEKGCQEEGSQEEEGYPEEEVGRSGGFAAQESNDRFRLPICYDEKETPGALAGRLCFLAFKSDGPAVP